MKKNDCKTHRLGNQCEQCCEMGYMRGHLSSRCSKVCVGGDSCAVEGQPCLLGYVCINKKWIAEPQYQNSCPAALPQCIDKCTHSKCSKEDQVCTTGYICKRRSWVLSLQHYGSCSGVQPECVATCPHKSCVREGQACVAGGGFKCVEGEWAEFGAYDGRCPGTTMVSVSKQETACKNVNLKDGGVISTHTEMEPGDCQKACMKLPTCQFVTHKRPHIRTTLGTCTLLSDCGKVVLQVGADSWRKASVEPALMRG